MSKSNGTRPVKPCWNCGSNDLGIKMCPELSNIGWWTCRNCGATTQENPTELGPELKVMPWNAIAYIVRSGWR